MSKTKKLTIIGFSLAIAIIFDLLFPYSKIGVNFFMFISILVLSLVFLRLFITKQVSNYWSYLLLIPIFWYAASVAIFNNNFVQIVAPLVTFFLLIVFLFWSGAVNYNFWQIKKIIPGSIFVFLTKFLFRITAPFKDFGKFDKVKTNKIFWAVFLLVPLIILFGALFIQADLVFEKIIGDIFDFSFSDDLAIRIIKIASFFFLLCGVFYAYIRSKRQIDENEKEIIEHKEQDNLVLNIILVGLNIFFVLFIVVQIMFLFGSHEVITKYDITYADYVHKGFYQMLMIALLVLGLSYAVIRFVKINKINLPKILTVVFIAQTLIICASALKRLYLYQQAYGLTQLRFLVWHFIIYTGLILLALAVSLIIKRNYQFLMKAGLIISIVYMMFMTAANMDAKIAKVNIDRYFADQTKEIDYKYLSRLSVDAFDQISKLNNTQTVDWEVSIKDYYLCGHGYQNIITNENDKWQDDSWSEWKLKNENKEYLKNLDCIFKYKEDQR